MAKKSKFAVQIIALTFAAMSHVCVHADDAIEKAGVAVGVSAGNMLFLPIKAIAVSMGTLFGALSFVVTGGNLELTKQIWQDTTEGPYVITPEVARMSVGQRPELDQRK